MSSVILLLSRYALATQAALAFLGAPPTFESLRKFVVELHLHEDYGGFCRDQIQRIQDFKREKNDTPHSMHTILVKFVRVCGGVFAESRSVKMCKVNVRRVFQFLGIF